MTKLAPIRPGEVLMEDFIGPLGITQHRLAVAIGVPPRRINEIVHGQRRITADTALRRGGATSAHQRSSGSTSRATMTSRSRPTPSVTHSTLSTRFSQRDLGRRDR